MFDVWTDYLLTQPWPDDLAAALIADWGRERETFPPTRATLVSGPNKAGL
jgi:hypothetical protein